ncbi:MAG: hypothetical protein BGO82_06710 [Devosia sp. 67-54]|nr:MAG: hypothetical protein BGO82_06710 [Devosia sp. 67-54]
MLTQSFVGNNGNEVGTSGQGFEQTGNNNDATILQYGSRNLALEVLQSDGNKLSVTQGRAGSGYLSNYAYNRINSIKQTNTGGAQNQATIIQQGVADAGVMNKIGSLVQSGSGNDVQLTQTGKRNALGTVSQQTTGNHISLSITGNYNGSDGVDALNEQVIGSFATLSRGFTAASAVTQGSVIQNGSNNQLDYVITGNNNLFGFSQTSSNNIVGGSIGSSRNQLTISQTATGGTGHSEATVNISGGDYNDIAVGQSIGGGTKLAVATIDVDGSNNSLNVVQGQIGNGRNSLIDVSIDGDFNNSVKLFTTGNAAYQALGNSSHRLAGSGQIQQGGSGNQLTYDLTGSYNQFAFYQTSTNNTIVGSTVGNNSQTVVNQTGPNNTANFSQFGGGNVMGVMQ